MPLIKVDMFSAPGVVRVRAKATDPNEGLRGHAYIQARNLNRPVPKQRADASSREESALRYLSAAPAPVKAPATVIPLSTALKRRPA